MDERTPAKEWLSEHREALIGIPMDEAERAIVSAGLRVRRASYPSDWLTQDLDPLRITLWVGDDELVRGASSDQ